LKGVLQVLVSFPSLFITVAVAFMPTPSGMVMDWREMAGKPTIRGLNGTSHGYAWSGGKMIGVGWKSDQWSGRTDPLRAWMIAICWLVACSAE